ncbi:MAG: hypothetical protein FWD53_10490 [Phycisphaerales bacterium]|nr:hypothetical protein [Phycisphaerales bacterium]
MILHVFAVLVIAATSLTLGGCGILTAPFSATKAIAANANYDFKGVVVDPDGKVLEGVVAVQTSQRRFWTPLKGATTTNKEDYIRVDDEFNVAVRGTNLSVKFSKNGYRDAVFNFTADANNEIVTRMGTWANSSEFAVLMVPVNARDAYLIRHTTRISYEHYPIADMISLPNLLTEGASGDVVYRAKDSADPTVIPDGTFYVVLDTSPPEAINSFGQIDPAELDIPNSLTLRIAGAGRDAGLIRMVPRAGMHPMLISTTAPETDYVSEITISRERLKEMRTAERSSIAGAAEYFYFRIGDRFGKGALSWSNRSGKPIFTFDLHVQRRAAVRDLTTFNYAQP